jgi:hypothetical protein
LGRENGFLSGPLDEALTGISLIASSKEGAWDLGGVERFVVAQAPAGRPSSVTREGRTVTYAIDLKSPMNADEFGQALASAIEGLRSARTT